MNNEELNEESQKQQKQVQEQKMKVMLMELYYQLDNTDEENFATEFAKRAKEIIKNKLKLDENTQTITTDIQYSYEVGSKCNNEIKLETINQTYSDNFSVISFCFEGINQDITIRITTTR